jgi:hypothetical protein
MKIIVTKVTYNEVLLGYQPGQVVEWWKNQCFKDHWYRYPYQHPEDEDRYGLQNVVFFTVQSLDLADSPRELHYTQLMGKQQMLQKLHTFKVLAQGICILCKNVWLLSICDSRHFETVEMDIRIRRVNITNIRVHHWNYPQLIQIITICFLKIHFNSSSLSLFWLLKVIFPLKLCALLVSSIQATNPAHHTVLI